MPAYRYIVQDGAGAIQRGVVEADAPRSARAVLRERGWLPIEIIPVLSDGQEKLSGASRWSSRWFTRWTVWQRAPSAAQLSLLTRQFATLLAAGLTIEQTLSALIDQTEDESSRQVLAAVRSEVMAGNTLHRALSRFPSTFPDIYCALVGAGEQSGELDTVMLRLADYTESRHALRQRLLLAFIYPAIVTVVALAVVIGLMTYVVPQIVGVFERTHQALPLLTRILIGLSDALQAGWPYLLMLLVASGWGFRILLRNEVRRRTWHRFLLRMPVWGRLLRSLAAARFASTLAILVGSGVPLLAALKAGADVVGNLVMKDAVDTATAFVREGGSLSRALGREKVFPPVMIHLIASGESSGRLDQMLDKSASQLENEVGNRVAVMTGLLEPLLIVVMGGVVLVIVLAILLPIINVNQLVR